MTNKKGIKRSLLMSALALLLCVSMLIGSTFAWFTDSVTSAGNIIKSGKLDVEMYWADGKEAPASANWKDASTTKIFDYDNWEPGYTEARHIAVKNEGTLALKYQLTIVPTGEVSKLAEVIDVYYINPAEQLDERADMSAYKPVGTLAQLINNEIAAVDVMPNGKLAADEGFVATLVLKMRESAGNEYQNLSIGTKFSVQLLATQFTSEKDSYDENYDGGASWLGDATIGWYFEDPDATEFVLSSAEDLAGLAAIVNGTATNETSTYALRATTYQDDFAGKTIKLASNIDLAGKSWTPIGNWDVPFAGTFDGNGYTISNLYINDATGEGLGFFGVAANATIQNVNLHNVKVNGYSMVAGLVGAAYPAIISNCHVSGNVNIVSDWAYAGGIAGYCYYGTQVDGCSVVAEEASLIQSTNRNAVGGITAWLLEGDHKVTNCQVKNIDLIGWTNVGGITGFVHYSNTISGCSVENVNLVKTRVDGNPGIGLIAGGWSYNASNAITLSNNTVKNATMAGNHVAYAAYNELYGSEYGGATTANFVLENNTTENVTNNLVEVVKASASNLKDTVKEANATVVLPAGTYTFPSSFAEGVTLQCAEGTVFEGTSGLNVNGATVIGATFSNDGGNAVSGTVNGTFKDCTFTGKNGLRGCYAGETVVFENCVFDGATYGMHFDGGSNDAVFKNCTISGFNAMGGEITKLTMEGCTFKSNGKSAYNGINLWGDAELIDCTFVFDGSASYEWVDLVNDGKTVSFTDCVVTDGKATKGIETVVGNYGTGNTIIIDGEKMALVSDTASLEDALTSGGDAILTGDITVAKSEAGSNGYGATGIHIGNGQTLDGNGNSVGVNAWSTWDSAINITSGTIKNVTVNSGMRGIFISHNGEAGKVYLENVIIDGTVYTISCDQGTNSGLEATKSTFNGWTSYAATIGDVKFTDCSFGEGQGYAFCRPYAPTTFVGCDFAAGYELDAVAAVTFEDCTIGGEALTAENLATLVVGGIANATVK